MLSPVCDGTAPTFPGTSCWAQTNISDDHRDQPEQITDPKYESKLPAKGTLLRPFSALMC